MAFRAAGGTNPLQVWAVLALIGGGCGWGSDRPAPARTESVAPSPTLPATPAATTTISASRAFGNSDTWGFIGELVVVGDSLFVYDLYGITVISVVDRRSGEIVGRFARKGKGPGEYLDMTDVFRAGTGAQFWIYDAGTRRLTLYDAASAGSTTPRVVGTRPVQAEGTPEYVRFTSDGLLMGGEFRGSPLMIADSTGRHVQRRFGRFPLHAPNDSTFTQLSINRPQVTFAPGLGRVAMAYVHQNVVQLYDLASGEMQSVLGPEQFDGPKDEDILDLNPSNVAYFGIRATKRFVYALFCGCRVSRRTLRDLNLRLHVFRWTGELVASIATDLNQPLFDVSPDDRYLYGVRDEPYPQVLEIPLPANLATAESAH